jgi:hypothetical protein
MCFKSTEFPFLIPFELLTSSTGSHLLTVSMLLGKVTTKRHGEHVSSRGMLYPIRQTIHDTKAVAGDHQYALHFAPTPECAIGLPDAFGSHRLVVIPGPAVWDPLEEWQPVKALHPGTRDVPEPRCWHAEGCTPLFCMDCWNLKPEDLNNMDFWRAFQKSCERADGSVLRIPREQVWQRQIEVIPN